MYFLLGMMMRSSAVTPCGVATWKFLAAELAAKLAGEFAALLNEHLEGRLAAQPTCTPRWIAQLKLLAQLAA